jgi:putative transcriptional regulator
MNDKKSIKKILTIQNVSNIIKLQMIQKVSKSEVIIMRVKLIELRTSKNLTQKELAEILNISEVYVRKIEKSERNPGRETMLKFEQFFGIRDRELFPDLFQVDGDTFRINSHTA